MKQKCILVATLLPTAMGVSAQSSLLFMLTGWEWIIIWVGFIFLNGKIAKWKGYPFWAGAISGIVLFWGTLLFLIMPFNKKRKTDEDK